MSRTAPSLCAALVVLAPLAASADNDIRLASFGSLGPGGALVIDTAGFGDLAGDLGQIMTARSRGPAATTGALGFDVSLELSVANVDQESSHWRKALESPAGTLQTFQLQLRKGLPFGFEVGGDVNHLIGSDLWGVGVGLKYAFLEGFRLLPDVSVRASVGTVLGSRDMSLLVLNDELIVSKAFGAGGVLAITPYLGFGHTLVHASSYVVGTFPTDAPQAAKFVLTAENQNRFQGVLGVRLASAHATLGLEAVLGKGVQIFTTRVGAEF